METFSCLTYIVFVSDVEFKIEWFSFGDVDLEHQKLMHYIETSIDTHLLGCHLLLVMVEVGRYSLRIWWQLNPLCLELEHVALDL